MGKYFCPECAHEIDEPICPVCNSHAESLIVDDEKGVPKEEEKYPEDFEDKVEFEDLEEVDETNEDNKEL